MAPPGTALSKSDSLLPLVPTLSLMPQDNRQAPFGTRVGQSMTNPTSSYAVSRDESRDRSQSLLEVRRGFVSRWEIHLHLIRRDLAKSKALNSLPLISN